MLTLKTALFVVVILHGMLQSSQGEDNIFNRRSRSVTPAIYSLCEFYDELLEFHKDHASLTLDQIVSTSVSISMQMQRFRDNEAYSSLVTQINGVVSSLNDMRYIRSKFVSIFRKITCCQNIGHTFKAATLPFYTHGNDILTWEEVKHFDLSKLVENGKALIQAIKEAVETSNVQEHTSLNQLLLVVNKLVDEASAAHTAFIKAAYEFETIQLKINEDPAVLQCQMGRTARTHPQQEIPPKFNRNRCPKCGAHGKCINLPFIKYCQCSPMWEGTNCNIKQTLSSMRSCTAFGDVHFETFDKAYMHVQDDCKKVMVMNNAVKPGFVVELQPYFVHPSDRVSWTEHVSIITKGVTTNTYIKIGLRDTNRNHFVEIDGKRVTTFPYNHIVQHDLHNGARLPFSHKIYISGNYAMVDVSDDLGAAIKFDGLSRSYVYLSDFWKNSVAGMCGNFDGNKDNDIKKRYDPLHNVIHGQNVGRTMSNTWKSSNTCQDAHLADLPWRTTVNRRSIDRIVDTPKFKLAELYCKFADCELKEGTFEWDSCVTDTYYSDKVDEQCDILEEQIFRKSKCWDQEFECDAIMQKADEDLRRR